MTITILIPADLASPTRKVCPSLAPFFSFNYKNNAVVQQCLSTGKHSMRYTLYPPTESHKWYIGTTD